MIDATSDGTNEALQAQLAAIVARAPDWVRQELMSKEPIVRTRAEQVLAAIIATAIRGPGRP